jgi:hypothetical protein
MTSLELPQVSKVGGNFYVTVRDEADLSKHNILGGPYPERTEAQAEVNRRLTLARDGKDPLQ